MSAATEAVQKWVEQVVIGLNFCPFAHREVERDTIVYQECHATALETSLQAFANAVQQLLDTPSKETTLLVFSKGFTEFDDYLELLDYAQLYLQQEDLEGVLQIASFHPDYQFADSTADGASNYTNRAPFPVLHILREASLERVLKRYPNPELIPQRNCEQAELLGRDYFEAILLACREPKQR
ncbi:hypothetical protein PSI9734_01057 [Pseudidiomarina piscicola]|uniref:DUF1415 domain-containing protein n=1 Tax=Pseudidiomarina piscicola TaxID=2614830 RepID=A0A6S6WL20_9GAMM|nr:hypothetical protein PSI9734_01057 [Pseudidiomarina piscicola]VZT40116.1 hypothetical protein PSI9734_01057 [Pseudomonas aeruginosa]